MHFLSNLLIVNLQFLLTANSNVSYHVILDDFRESSKGKKRPLMYRYLICNEIKVIKL